MANEMYCPSCGAEYVSGSTVCVDCRVQLVAEPAARGRGEGRDDDDFDDGAGADLVEMGDFPRLSAQILRRRLESAGVTVMVEWSGVGADAAGTIVVPGEQSDFAYSVINEVSVETEMPDTSPSAYVALIEEHLAQIDALLDELRTKIAEPVADDGSDDRRRAIADDDADDSDDDTDDDTADDTASDDTDDTDDDSDRK